MNDRANKCAGKPEPPSISVFFVALRGACLLVVRASTRLQFYSRPFQHFLVSGRLEPWAHATVLIALSTSITPRWP